jgi:hypothetical protein
LFDVGGECEVMIVVGAHAKEEKPNYENAHVGDFHSSYYIFSSLVCSKY